MSILTSPYATSPSTSFRLSLCLRSVTCALLLVLLQACASTPPTLNYYDFGVTAKPVGKGSDCHLPPINLTEITSPNSLDSDLMLYRLLYANDQQSHAYASHRWSMPPAQLLTLRIKTQLADHGVTLIDNGINDPNTVQLRLELIDFGQYFSDATHSYSQLQLRATIIRERGRTLLAQTTLQQQVNAETADAPGGAQAMRMATDALMSNLSNWLCEKTHP